MALVEGADRDDAAPRRDGARPHAAPALELLQRRLEPRVEDGARLALERETPGELGHDEPFLAGEVHRDAGSGMGVACGIGALDEVDRVHAPPPARIERGLGLLGGERAHPDAHLGLPAIDYARHFAPVYPTRAQQFFK